MKIKLLIVSLFCSILFACGENKDEQFIFFLHNRFLEEQELNDSHLKFGRAEYKEILAEFEKRGFKVISEKRKPNTDIKLYARKTIEQIDSLIASGIQPENITIVGTSKGGFIAEYVSTFAQNSKLNYVFIGASFRGGLEEFPDLNLSGNILSINEKSDEGAVSFKEQIKKSKNEIKNFKEIELSTGMEHGFLFKPLKEWIEPTIKWANGNYELE